MDRLRRAAAHVAGLGWVFGTVLVSVLVVGGLLWLERADDGEGPYDEADGVSQAAHGSAVVGQWGMSHGEGGSESAGAMTFLGNWRQVSGVVGGAVEFTSPPGSGVARGTGDMNPVPRTSP